MQQTVISTRSTKTFFLSTSPGPSLFECLVPNANVWYKTVAVITAILLVSLLAQARFFLPDNPVPITFQGFGVLMMGSVLGLRLGLLSAIGYYLVGMAGLPVFAKGGAGWDYVVHGVTGGYLLGFILAASVIGYLSQRGWNRGRSLWPMMIGSLLIYAPALIWLSVFDFSWPAEGKLLSSAFYPFIAGDLLKLVSAAALTGGLWHLVDRKK